MAIVGVMMIIVGFIGGLVALGLGIFALVTARRASILADIAMEEFYNKK